MDTVVGYRIYYGVAIDKMTSTVDVPGQSSVSDTIQGIPHGDYFFGVVSYDANGAESDLSPVVNVEFWMKYFAWLIIVLPLIALVSVVILFGGGLIVLGLFLGLLYLMAFGWALNYIDIDPY